MGTIACAEAHAWCLRSRRPQAPAGSQGPRRSKNRQHTSPDRLRRGSTPPDFDAMAAMDLRPQLRWSSEAILPKSSARITKLAITSFADLRNSYLMCGGVRGAADKLDPGASPARCVAFLEAEAATPREVSVFLLYKELMPLGPRVNRQKPLLAKCFAHMAR